MRKIRVATATLAVMIALTFASCGNNSTKTEVENRPQQEVKETKEYSKELASFFNSEKESVNNYAGLGEFGFISKVDDTKISEEKMEIFITNTYLDMSVSESGKSEEDLTKKCVYTIDNNQVIEKKIGDDEQVSLIEELIILKAGAEEGSE